MPMCTHAYVHATTTTTKTITLTFVLYRAPVDYDLEKARMLNCGNVPSGTCEIPADVDGSGVVDIRDLLEVLSYFNVGC